MEETALAPEVAEAEFNRFVKIWDIDDSAGSMSVEDKATFDSQKNRIIKELCRGNAVLDEEGRFKYTLQHPRKDGALTDITFDISRGNKAVMDGFKERETMKKTAAYIGSLIGQPLNTFLNMDPRDQKFAEALVVLFLAS